MSKYIKYVCVVSAFLFTAAHAFAAPPSVEEGKNIFNTRCTSCHNVNKELTGPALGGVNDRRKIEWIIKFVHSSQTVVKSGDAYATKLYGKFNVVMPDQPDLTEDQIKSIVEYIKSEAKQISTEKPPFAKPGKLRPNYTPLSITENQFFFISYLMLVALIVIIMVFAVEVKAIQRQNRETA